ncbi:MAG: ABC transporter substrate-binding protein [Burkholderiales bacterium]|nr:ABC transporter substrate-binding protein [Burkholderiales bacterium]
MRLVALLIGLFCACAHASTLVVCTAAAPEGFDPALYASASTYDASSDTIYNSLVQNDPASTAIEPALAERWSVSPDGLQYTFYLRHGVKFQTTDWFKPSREMNADDVLWTYQRMLDSKHPGGATVNPGGWPIAESFGLAQTVRRLEKIDPYTVRFTLNRPDAPFLSYVGHFAFSIISAEYAQQLHAVGKDAQLNTLPVGTGPFVFKRYDKGAQVRYEANPTYWRGKVAADKLVLTIVPDPAVRMQKLKRGECGLVLFPKPTDVAQIKTDPDIGLAQSRSLVVHSIIFNTQHHGLGDARVRRALALALDRTAIVRAVYGDAAVPASSPIPSTLWGADAHVGAMQQDIARARQLLKEAGYADGLTLTLYVRNGGGSNPNPTLTAEMIQSDWARIGVTAKLVVLEWGELLRRANAGEHDVLLMGWGGAVDPDLFISPILSCAAVESGNNQSRWCNHALDALLDEGRRTTEIKARTAIYEKAQRLLADEMPLIPLAEPIESVTYRKNMPGLRLGPVGVHRFEDVTPR